MDFDNSDEFLTALSHDLALHGANSDQIGTFLKLAEARPDWKKLAETAIGLRQSYEQHVKEHPDDESLFSLESAAPARRPPKSTIWAHLPAAIRHISTGLVGAVVVCMVWYFSPPRASVAPAKFESEAHIRAALAAAHRDELLSAAAEPPADMPPATAEQPDADFALMISSATDDAVEPALYRNAWDSYASAILGKPRVSRDRWNGFVSQTEQRFDDEGYCDGSALLKRALALLRDSGQSANGP